MRRPASWFVGPSLSTAADFFRPADRVRGAGAERPALDTRLNWAFSPTLAGRDTGAIFDSRPDNVFVIKATCWLGT